MTDRLSELLAAQRQLQIDSFGVDPATLDGEDRTTFLLWNAYALADEVHELMNEVGWKPWATSRHVNEEEATGEWIDLIHFAVNILWAIAPSHITLGDGIEGSSEALAEHVIERYHAKRKKNAARQEDGYDGVEGKCPGCKRDLEEVVLQRLYDAVTHRAIGLACACGRVLHQHEAPKEIWSRYLDG